MMYTTALSALITSFFMALVIPLIHTFNGSSYLASAGALWLISWVLIGATVAVVGSVDQLRILYKMSRSRRAADRSEPSTD